jgi:hypothetical protein
MATLADSKPRSVQPPVSWNDFSVDFYKDGIDKRAYPRRYFPAPLEIAYINKHKRFDAQLVNHCEGGMCIKSKTAYTPGAILNVRLKNFRPNEPCAGLFDGLRTMALAEVKWCHDASDNKLPCFNIGIKFPAPFY